MRTGKEATDRNVVQHTASKKLDKKVEEETCRKVQGVGMKKYVQAQCGNG